MSIWRPLMVLALAALLVACASRHYNITTHEGQIYESIGKPHYDEDAKTYTFKARDDHRVILNQRDVKEIKELAD